MREATSPQTLRRSRLERQLDILNHIAAHGPIRRTHIMYKANVSWEELNKDLGTLKLLGLVAENPSKEGVFYTATETGRTVLAHYRQVEEALKVSRSNLQSSPSF